MRALFDVNVLIALFQPNHVHHRPAHEWWSNNQHYGWASCPLTQNGFVRIVSQLRHVSPLTQLDAARHLAEQVETTDHHFWPDDISILDAGCFDAGAILGPKQITDVYLLALAVRNSGRLVTFDRSIPISAAIDANSGHLEVL